ncbi:MAG: winged helix-turn-helix transcriptional regulator, partial [Nitratireductor sp.]|nr:winged helix-turn-helix transcriptional regulator [Nitratireductor sp.]
MDDIPQIRRFNRIVTQRIGALSDSYLARGRPLGEARIVHELGAGGATDLQVLRGRLNLDSGYMSRLLRSLEKQGLLAVEPKPEDTRARVVSLTDAGAAEFAAYDALSDELAKSLLGSLDASRRARLVQAM